MFSQHNLIIRVAKLLIIFLAELIVPFGLLLIPFLLFPFLLQAFLSRKRNSKYGPLLTGMSSLAAADKIYEQPLYAVLLFYFVDGEIDLEEHRELFKKNVIDARDGSTGELIYPQLRCSVARVLGYSIWKEDEEFKVSNHIRLCNKEVFNLERGQDLNEHALAKSANEILAVPFAKEKSPWEIMIFHGAKSLESPSKKQSLIIFRYHHALSDGYSITKLMSHVTTGEYYAAPPSKRNLPPWGKWAQFLAFPFVGIYVLCTYIANYIDENAWRFSTHEERHMRYYCSGSLSVQDVKNAKTKLNTSFNALVLCGISGGIRKFFQLRKGPIPNQMHVGISFPVPGHPANKLTNHWTAAIINLHTEIEDKKARLDAIAKQFKSTETKIVSQLPFIGAQWGGAFPARFIKLLLKTLLQGSTCSMSIFPGPANLRFLSGERILSGGFLLGPLETHGVAITVISYDGHMRIYFGIEKALEDSEKDGDQVTKYISEGIQSMIDLPEQRDLNQN